MEDFRLNIYGIYPAKAHMRDVNYEMSSKVDLVKWRDSYLIENNEYFKKTVNKI